MSQDPDALLRGKYELALRDQRRQGERLLRLGHDHPSRRLELQLLFALAENTAAARKACGYDLESEMGTSSE